MEFDQEELLDRVVPKIRVKEDCWEWTGAHIPQGYGTINYKGKTVRAHRAVWMACFGEIPKDLFVLHDCDNPGCVNPDHLLLGTNRDNVQDMIMKGRRGRPNVKLTEDQVREIKSMLKSECYTLQEIGDTFGVTLTCIYQIKSGANWSWL
jgi:hypothetical protein